MSAGLCYLTHNGKIVAHNRPKPEAIALKKRLGGDAFWWTQAPRGLHITVDASTCPMCSADYAKRDAKRRSR